MKRLIAVTAACGVVVLMSGCAGQPMQGAWGSMGPGIIYGSVDGPLFRGAPVGETTSSSKVGSATSKGYVGGIVSIGDSSVKAAMDNGGITKIHNIDYKYTNILGIFSTYTTVVYGE